MTAFGIALLRRYYPRTVQRIITNGNYDFRKSLKGVFVEDIVVSCDGAIQENYEKYRINGDIQKVFRFMADAHRYSPKTKIIWKYILFEFNDTDEEILLAQDIADECGVKEMRFVITGTKYRSERFHLGNTHELPARHSRLSVRLNPLMSRIEQMGTIEAETLRCRAARRFLIVWRSLPKCFNAKSGFGRVFTTLHWEKRYLVVEAWAIAASRRELGPFELVVEGKLSATQDTAYEGQSLLSKALRTVGLRVYRFRFSTLLAQPLPQQVSIEILVTNGNAPLALLGKRFDITNPLSEHHA